LLFMASGQQAYGQGCVAARQGGPMIGSLCAGGSTANSPSTPGRWEVSFGYRWLDSFRHFVGDVEQPQRVAQDTQQENKIHLFDVAVWYRGGRRCKVVVG